MEKLLGDEAGIKFCVFPKREKFSVFLEPQEEQRSRGQKEKKLSLSVSTLPLPASFLAASVLISLVATRVLQGEEESPPRRLDDGRKRGAREEVAGHA